MKRVLADTSLLVAAMVESHPAHARAFPWLRRAQQGEIAMVVCAHTLAELYAVLTRLPVSPRIHPATARRLIRVNIEEKAEVRQLTGKDYKSVLDEMSGLGLSGGIIYDGLAVQAAKRAGVEAVLTLNAADFRRVWPEAGEAIVAV